ncbi:MAG: L-threonylcarbamoyladenylate synthase [Thermodesulfobacteriota bacterium]|nr:L-threonylcarbamoyladenylate synthase [Thermodesulfobacteriota bacterium]
MTNPVLDSQIQKAIRLLKQGGLIAFPTETYYGLGVDPFNTKALQRLFKVKRRGADKAVLVLVADQSQVERFADSIPVHFNKLMSAFWPGPLTLVFPARSNVSELLTGGTGTVGIRQSPNPVAIQLLQELAGPITATSANRSGASPATTAAEVEEIFGSEVDLIIDGGATPGGQGSTLVGFDQKIFCIRDGKIPFETIRNSL